MLNFDIKAINGTDFKSILDFDVNSLNKQDAPPTPIEKFALKDVDGNYLFDSDNNKLFVRG